MSRTRRAGITAAFGYVQFAVALASGVLVVPLVLSRVPTAQYGVWLAFGEVLAYSAMADFGVLGVLPWLVAESDGRGNRRVVRALVASGVTLAAGAAALFLLLAGGAMFLAPAVADVAPGLRQALLGPLLLLVVGMAAGFPLRVYQSVLMGLQDVRFGGMVALAQLVLGVALTVGLLLGGFGLYALAASAVAPSLAAGLACRLRLGVLAPDLLRGRRLPRRTLLRAMATQGFGGWTSTMGWRMIAASDSLVVLAVAGPAAAVVFAMTAKLGEIAMQMSWQLPDATLVGLAQLKGEGRPERVREVILSLVRLTLVGAGAVACGVLAFNPSLVTLWVGGARFGGLALNAALAAEMLAHSLGHTLFTTAATVGARVQAGWLSLLHGVVNLALALPLGRAFGLPGVAAATVLSTLLVAVPAGGWMLRRSAGLDFARLRGAVLGPWLARIAPLLALGGAVGALSARALWAPLALAPFLAVLYLWVARPLYASLPLPPRARRVLAAFRLVEAA